MRFLALTLTVAALVALGSTQALAVSKIHEVTVSADGFSIPDLTIKLGDTVHWTGEAGTVLKSGDPGDPDNAGKVFTLELTSTTDQPEAEWTFDTPGTYPYFASPTVTGIITVKEATPVEERTWGWLKSVFETPGAPGVNR
jgi:plastocyanin